MSSSLFVVDCCRAKIVCIVDSCCLFVVVIAGMAFAFASVLVVVIVGGVGICCCCCCCRCRCCFHQFGTSQSHVEANYLSPLNLIDSTVE